MSSVGFENKINEGNVFIDGQPVCDDGWGEAEANIACRCSMSLSSRLQEFSRMLGFETGVATTESRFGVSSDDFAMDDLECRGDEETLFDCTYNSHDDDCGQGEAAGVVCYRTSGEEECLVEGRRGSS
jgi:hypothetical protein